VPSIEEERRRRVEERIVAAATDVLFRDGPDATVEAVAAEAGVGRATVFRYFPQRDELLAAGLRRAYAGFIGAIAERGNREPDEWLRDVVAASVSRARRGGTGYLRTLLDPGDGALAEVVHDRRPFRRELNERIAADLWQAHGGTRRSPHQLVDVVALLTGPHAIHALHEDVELDDDEIADRLAWLLRAAAHQLVEETKQDRGRTRAAPH
jgi:AcrR family transcriptional regulator